MFIYIFAHTYTTFLRAHTHTQRVSLPARATVLQRKRSYFQRLEYLGKPNPFKDPKKNKIIQTNTPNRKGRLSMSSRERVPPNKRLR